MDGDNGAAPELWKPSASLETLKQRAAMLAGVREFFAAREVLEVETPMLSMAGNTSPAIDSFSCRQAGKPWYWHTSPEFPMKRLLASGSGPIYQICKVFRRGESGRLHNPEFTLLEWYRPGMNYHQLMDEVDQLIQALLRLPVAEKLSYGQVFQAYLGLDVHDAGVDQLQACAQAHGLDVVGLEAVGSVDAWRDVLLSHLIEPRLGVDRPLFVYDYPASQAALARVRQDQPAVAERFELYIKGVEIANGYQELTDADEQAARFHLEQVLRRQQGQDEVTVDAYLLQALEYGLPDCAGVALGLDRLLMIAEGADTLADVLSFSCDRA